MNKASFPGIKTWRDEEPELQQDPRGPEHNGPNGGKLQRRHHGFRGAEQLKPGTGS